MSKNNKFVEPGNAKKTFHETGFLENKNSINILE